MMFDFFVVGQRPRWWGGPKGLIGILPEYSAGVYKVPKGEEGWNYIHERQLLGGWELFPWHSSKDGLTLRARRVPWLREFFKESIKAALRLHPKVVLVASKEGYELVRRVLLPELEWKDSHLGTAKPVAVSYCRLESGSEVVGLNRQIFSVPARPFKNAELIELVRSLRNRG